MRATKQYLSTLKNFSEILYRLLLCLTLWPEHLPPMFIWSFYRRAQNNRLIQWRYNWNFLVPSDHWSRPFGTCLYLIDSQRAFSPSAFQNLVRILVVVTLYTILVWFSGFRSTLARLAHTSYYISWSCLKPINIEAIDETFSVSWAISGFDRLQNSSIHRSLLFRATWFLVHELLEVLTRRILF